MQTRRWNDEPGADEGTRILVTRYRPRGLAKAAETWDEWLPAVGPSEALHAAVYGKRGSAGLSWDVYRARYRAEMLKQMDVIRGLATRVAAGETITLLCSSQCVRASRCHRELLRELIEAEVGKLAAM